MAQVLYLLYLTTVDMVAVKSATVRVHCL